MKKPVKAKPALVKPAPKAAPGKAAQPGNAPGRGKAAHAKPAPAKPKPKPVLRQVKAQRHAAAVKASKTRAANAKKARQHPRRQLALGSAVACCCAEALAASLRLAGHPVTDADVLALYLRTTRDLDAGAPVLATLEAAGEFGLAGVRLLSYAPVDLAEHVQPPLAGGFYLGCTEGIGDDGDDHVIPAGTVHPASVILGLALPAPHAVLDTGSEWISWGQAWPVSAFPEVVIEEAWEVSWPDTR